MMKKCKNLRIRSKKGKLYGYCALLKKEVSIYCKCDDIEYKEQKTLKKTTYSHSKKEKERFSIIYQDKTKCCYCGSKTGHIDTNEVFEGAYRSLSIKYGACNYYCRSCHKRFDEDRIFNLQEKIKFQKQFVKLYGYEWFIKIFKQDYEVKLSKIKKHIDG